MNLKELLTTSEAAQALRVSPRTLEGLRRTGGGPAFVKLGRVIRYRRQDVEAWIEQGVRRSTSQEGGRDDR